MNKKKKILLVTFSNISDHQDKVVVLYEEMRKKGYNVFLLLPEKIDVECEKSNRTWFMQCPDRPGIAKGTFNIKHLFLIIRKVKKGNFDYILFETLHLWNLPLMLSSGKNTEVFQMIHDVIPHGGDRTAKQVELMNRTVCKWADKIIICNNKYKTELCKRYKISSNKVKCIELWERYPEFQEAKKSGYMLFFGRLNPYKGANNLLKIVELCLEIKFDIIGKSDPQVTEIIKELKKFPNVTVDERYVSDNEIKSIFQKCEWVILPYNSATQSGVVVESYKHSKPVISFDVGAISEQVEDGKTGFLVASGDIATFAEKIQKANATSQERYNQYCKSAYGYGYEKFSPQKAAEKLSSLFK